MKSSIDIVLAVGLYIFNVVSKAIESISPCCITHNILANVGFRYLLKYSLLGFPSGTDIVVGFPSLSFNLYASSISIPFSELFSVNGTLDVLPFSSKIISTCPA